MEITKVAKTAKMWNTLLIIATIIEWTGIWISNFVIEINVDLGLLIYYAISIVYGIFAIVALVFIIISMKKMSEVNLKGGGLMLASAIVTIVTAIMVLTIGMMIGLIVFILSGISNKQITDSAKQIAFENDIAQNY